MRIAIFGVGAMGSLFGARLTAHADVTLIGHWPEQLAELSRREMVVIYPDGREEAVRVAITDHASVGTNDAAPYDIALILTKSAYTADAAQAAARILTPDGIAVTLQNGLGNLEIIAEHVGANRAVLGVTTQGAALDAPGVLRIGGTGVTAIAAGQANEVLVRELVVLLNLAHLKADVVEDVTTLAWGKLAVNAAINPLSAILRVRNGALLDSEHARAVMSDAAREVGLVAAANGAPLPFDAPARVEEVARLTAPNRSSMLQDVLRRAPTEIEAINGAVIRKGAECGIPTPANTMLYHLIKSLEASYDAQITA